MFCFVFLCSLSKNNIKDNVLFDIFLFIKNIFFFGGVLIQKQLFLLKATYVKKESEEARNKHFGEMKEQSTLTFL